MTNVHGITFHETKPLSTFIYALKKLSVSATHAAHTFFSLDYLLMV